MRDYCTGCGKPNTTVKRLHCELCVRCYNILQVELQVSLDHRIGPRYLATYGRGEGAGNGSIGCGIYIATTPAEAMAEAKRTACRNDWLVLRVDIQRTLTDIFVHPAWNRFFTNCPKEALPFDTARYGEIPPLYQV